MKRIERIAVLPADSRQEGITGQYAASAADWIWTPQSSGDTGFALFELDFELPEAAKVTAQVSGDARFEWYLDGEYAGMGPDRGDFTHWAFAAYRLELAAGHHRIEARAWCGLPNVQPTAQFSRGGGFLFAAVEPEWRGTFNTGIAPWKVRPLNGVAALPRGWFCFFNLELDVTAYFTSAPALDPEVVQARCDGNLYGVSGGGRHLYPSNLPEQTRTVFSGPLTVRAILLNPSVDAAEFPVTETDTVRPEAAGWQAFLDGTSPMTVPAGQTVAVIFDTESYLCAYPVLTLRGGPDAAVQLSWAESLYGDDAKAPKGDRNAVIGKKYVIGPQNDKYMNFDGVERAVTPFWWRAGRYLLLAVHAGSEPMVLTRLVFQESRYPLEPESQIAFDVPEYNQWQDMMIRALKCCSHETFMDCPYYEQLMYVGDTRLEALATYALTSDARLTARALELFRWSASRWDGLISERYPSVSPQLSATFSMLWPLMVRDHLLYRRPDTVLERGLRRGVRNLLLALDEYVREDGLIADLPGWSFVDWVEEWPVGIPAGAAERKLVSPALSRAPGAVFSLHYLLSLRTAMEMEESAGEGGSEFLSLFQARFERTAAAVRKCFYLHDKALFADDLNHTAFSVHAQSLALLAGVLPPDEAERCCYAMLDTPGMRRPTVYFSHYFFEALRAMGQTERIFDSVDAWRNMAEHGAVTTWEAPEPSRSDCHAWGAHLLYHYYSTFAGIRPASAGFRSVRIAPVFGPLHHIAGRMVHPDGVIEFEFHRSAGNGIDGRVVLPKGVSGRFSYRGFGKLLSEGVNEIHRPESSPFPKK